MEEQRAEGRNSALILLIGVEGSSYRLPGAKMAADEDGNVFGMVSGGCLEADLAERARQTIEDHKSQTVTYDLSSEEMWGLGIGCGGSVEFLILPIYAGEDDDRFWRSVREPAHSGNEMTLVLDVERPAERWLVPAEVGGVNIPSDIAAILAERSYRSKAGTVRLDGRRLFVDTLVPAERLVISGAGPDAVPVAAMAAKVGFDVTLLDPRKERNQEIRFPGVRHRVADPSEVSPDEFSGAWWIVMNHNKERDGAALALALQSAPAYVGMLGPRRRTEEIAARLGLAEELDRLPVHAPIGLDLNGETYEEVAVSIVAELMGLRGGRSGGHLLRTGKIHAT